MVMSDYTKLRVLSLHWQGLKVSAIVEHLVLEDGIKLSKQGVRRVLKVGVKEAAAGSGVEMN